MKHPLAFIVFCVLSFGFLSDLSARTWTIQKEPLEGECLRSPSESLVEIQIKEETIVVPQAWLSQEDRDYIAEHFPYKPEKAPAETVEPPQNQASEAESKPAETVPPDQEDGPDFWRIAEHTLLGILALGILLLVFRDGRALRSKPSEDSEEEESPRKKGIPEGLPFIGPVLDGERFAYSSDLDKKAEEQAAEWADTVATKLDQKLEKIRNPNAERIQHIAQNIADDINWDFTQKMCAEDSFWIKKIYGENTKAPDDLAEVVDNLLSPVQVPAAREIRLEVSPCAIGIVAAIGAVLGAWILSFYAFTGGMKQPGDITVLLGATVGTALFTALMMWIAAHEKVRQTLVAAFKAAGVADAGLTFMSVFTSLGQFFGKSRSEKLARSFLKRLCFWLGGILILHLLKREIVFDRDDYKNRLESLFRERIQSIVMLLALYKAEKEYIVSEQDKWAKKEEELEARVKGNKNVLDTMKSLVPKLKDFQKAPLSEIIRSAKVMLQEFRILGFDIPKEPVHWESELNDLLQDSDTSPAPSEPSQPTRRTIKWSGEKREEYEVYGDPDEGEEVEVLEEPVFQNGKVFKKGVVHQIF